MKFPLYSDPTNVLIQDSVPQYDQVTFHWRQGILRRFQSGHMSLDINLAPAKTSAVVQGFRGDSVRLSEIDKSNA
jgi:hypothetical protein